MASKRLSSSSLSDLCLQLQPRGKMAVPAAATEKQVQCTGTHGHQHSHPTATAAPRGPYTVRRRHLTQPRTSRAPALHLPSPRAPPWPRHAPRARPARGASRRLPAQPSACPHFCNSVCLSLPLSRAGHWQRRRGHRGGTRVDARQARAPRAHIYKKKKIGPIIGAPPACLGHVSRAAWWLHLHVRRAWHRAATPTAARANCVAERGR